MLPLVQTDARTARATDTTATVHAVLVVEDDAIVASDLQQMVIELGYDAYAAPSSGAEALQLARQRSPDIVLMDIRLHGAMDGIDAAEQLRRRYGTEIIFVTAHADDATIERSRAAEPGGYLIKPITAPALKAALAHALDRHMRERTLAEATARLKQMLDNVSSAVIVEDARGRVLFHNRSFPELFGLEPNAAAVGSDALDLSRQIGAMSVDDASFHLLENARRRGRQAGFADLVRLTDGRVLERDYMPLTDEPVGPGHLWAWRDVSEREQERQAIEASATHNRQLVLIDELTGLHSRRGFYNLAEVYLRHLRRNGRQEQLFYLDLNQFKQINDRYGHAAGDQALRQMSATLLATFSNSALITRLGGDEFVVLVSMKPEDVETAKGRVRALLEAFNERNEVPYRLQTSIGVAQYEPGESLDSLVDRADRAMYSDKRQSRTSQL